MDAYRALSLAFTEILGLIANLSPKQGHFESLSTHDSAFLEAGSDSSGYGSPPFA